MLVHYLDFYEKEYARARRVAKHRSKVVVLGVSILTAAIAVIGTVTTFTGFLWLGIASSVAAGCIAVLTAWEGHFQHRDVWIQKSVAVAALQRLRRDVEIEAASTSERTAVAMSAMRQLNSILESDLDRWAGMKDESARPQPSSEPEIVDEEDGDDDGGASPVG